MNPKAGDDHTHSVVATQEPSARLSGTDAARLGRANSITAIEHQPTDAAAWRSTRHPRLSAERVLTTRQELAALSGIAALAIALFFDATSTAIALIAVVSAFYLFSILYKSLLAARSLSRHREIIVAPEEVAILTDLELPVYTVLLALYKEANVVADLVCAIRALDYPPGKLDVKLLLEADDEDTRAVVAGLALEDYFETLVVPPRGPKNKPKACNYGLSHARGAFVVLYDAEDRPEPDQLKKVIVAFRRAEPRLACIQAKLSYYNSSDNLLTKWFTAEYAAWFDLYLPGLNALRAPIPLGGTSNHFRTDLLRQIGGWDPFNVTEDADLGILLARCGLETAVIDSVTYEEANGRLGNWIRQRSRWVKGYMQTWLVHTRDPLRLLKDLGPGGFVAFQVMVFGTFFAFLVNPLFWGLVGVWYATHWSGIETVYPRPVLYASLLALFVGNFSFIYLGVLGCLRRPYYAGVKYAALMPLYWLLMSVAAWKALLQLVTRPSYWEKTEHGLAVTPRVIREPRPEG